MGTKNHPGAFDCYANAHPDEPMFILLARDRHAPLLVGLWARLRELSGEDPAKVAEARQCWAAMIEWQNANGRPAQNVALSRWAAALLTVTEFNSDPPSREVLDLIREAENQHVDDQARARRAAGKPWL